MSEEGGEEAGAEEGEHGRRDQKVLPGTILETRRGRMSTETPISIQQRWKPAKKLLIQTKYLINRKINKGPIKLKVTLHLRIISNLRTSQSQN